LRIINTTIHVDEGKLRDHFVACIATFRQHETSKNFEANIGKYFLVSMLFEEFESKVYLLFGIWLDVNKKVCISIFLVC